jgi:Dolichyl-phosphate-mannose-protein mannosyltransferase
MKLLEESAGTSISTEPIPQPIVAPRTSRAIWIAALCIFAIGCFLRIYPWLGFKGIGFDEALYRGYVEALHERGFSNMPTLSAAYLEKQSNMEGAILPPTRFIYIAAATTWRNTFFADTPAEPDLRAPDVARKDPALISLRSVSCTFAILTLLVGAVFARRLGGDRAMLGVLALLACAPTQLHMAQHGLIDGVFAFWALTAVWLLWENLHRPDAGRWQAAYAATIAIMVLTKENAAFVYVALTGLILFAWWQKWGRITRRLVLTHIVGALLGGVILTLLAGGPQECLAIYLLLKARAQMMPYAIRTGDGPWFRYIFDLLCASPLTLLFAIGAIFHLTKEKKPLLFLTAFIGVSYAMMCNVKYGMNLRYTNMWDMPLRMLAFTQVAAISARFGRRENVALIVGVLALAAFDLRQYDILFVQFDKDYEMISANLLQALKILKFN